MERVFVLHSDTHNSPIKLSVSAVDSFVSPFFFFFLGGAISIPPPAIGEAEIQQNETKKGTPFLLLELLLFLALFLA